MLFQTYVSKHCVHVWKTSVFSFSTILACWYVRALNKVFSAGKMSRLQLVINDRYIWLLAHFYYHKEQKQKQVLSIFLCCGKRKQWWKSLACIDLFCWCCMVFLLKKNQKSEKKVIHLFKTNKIVFNVG